MVTGPMPRKPNATSPNANTAGGGPRGARPLRAEQVGAEVPRHEAREDAQRGPTLARRGDDLAHMPGLRGGEDLDQLGNDGPGQRAAGDDRRELPPEATVAQVADEHVGGRGGQDHAEARGEAPQ